MRLDAAVDWFRQRGLRWVARRALDEAYAPRSRLLRTVRGVMQPAPVGRNGDTLYFFFDLHVCPVAYDIATYMAAAELERRRLGLAAIHVVFVPGRHDGLRQELPAYEAAVGAEARRWRLHNLVVPVATLLPSCSGYTVCASRAEAEALFRSEARHVYPCAWRPDMPVAPAAREVRDAGRSGSELFPLLRASGEGLRHADAWLAAHAAGRRPVVITLRQYAYTPDRNSDVAAWGVFAHGLDRERFAPVIVPDTAQAMEPLPDALAGLPCCAAAAWNVHLRIALYERAFVNLAVVHGPMELCWYDETARYVLFCRPDTAPLTRREVLEREGFEVGAPLPFARPWQRWVWERDSREAIERAFSRYCEDFGDGAGGAP